MALIPVRWVISMLGIYACALVYTQRAGMSVSIVAMTTIARSTTTTSEQLNPTASAAAATHECAKEDDRLTFTAAFFSEALLRSPRVNQSQSDDRDDHLFKLAKTEKETAKAEFEWNEKLQGVILGSQFYLYIFVPTLAGRATDILGGKWVAFAGTLVPALLSALTPVLTRAWGAPALITIRILMGGMHGFVYPSLFSLYTKYFPVEERANANAGLSFGGGLGSTVMYLLAGWLVQTDIGWPMVFYANTLLAVPWCLLWLWYVTNDPEVNGRLGEAEKKYITTSIPKMAARRTPARWSQIFTSVPVLCSLVVKLCCGFGYFLLLTKMPSYLSTIFGIDFFKNGSVNAASSLAQGLFGLLAAPLSNAIIARTSPHLCRSIVVRKTFQTVAMIGPAVCLCLVPAFGCNSTGVIVMLVGAMLLYGFFTGGEWTTVSEYAPNSAGTVFGFANILAFASGVAAPYLVGILLDSSSGGSHRAQWNIVFYITAALYVFGALTFILFGTDVQQAWDRVGGSAGESTDAAAATAASATAENSSSDSSIGSKDTLDIDRVDVKVAIDHQQQLQEKKSPA